MEKYLKKALGLCAACKTAEPESVDLYVHLLNTYLYYYETLGAVRKVSECASR